MNRRIFLKKSAIAIPGGLITINIGSSFGQDINKKKSIRWAFFADTHIPAVDNSNTPPRGHYFYNPHENLRKIVSEVLDASPDGVAIAGDLARLTGQVGDYTVLKKLLTPLSEKVPVFISFGNHDHRGNFFEVFDELPGKKQPVKGKCVVVPDIPVVRVIMLDSLFYTNKVAGLLGKAQRKWLAGYLDNNDNTPTILCLHHTLSDSDSALLDLPRLYDIIVPIRKVKAIVYGHSHGYKYSEFEGIHQINLPATGYSFNSKGWVGWVEAQLTAKGGDFTPHTTEGNRDKDGTTIKLTWRL